MTIGHARCAPNGPLDIEAARCSKGGMSKALALLILAMMVVHLIRPLGLPGLRARRDVWKIAVAALVAIGATVMLSHGS